MEQLQLFSESVGRPPTPPPGRKRDVIFYALLLGTQVFRPASRLVTAVRQAHGVTERMRTTDTFHISVLGLGHVDELSEDDVQLGIGIAEDVAFEPFELVFSELLSWGGNKTETASCPLVLTCSAGDVGVLRLAARLMTAMIARGFRPRSFAPHTPHLTLLYDTVRVPKTVLDPPITVQVEGFSLVHSHRGESEYSVLWPPRDR